MHGRRWLWLFILLALAQTASAKLTADQLLLVANRNLPESIELARYYQKARGVPEDRILELDLPKSEMILPDVYESRLAAPVREYLRSPKGKNVRCVVLVYGVPLHIQSIESTVASREEAAQVRQLIDELDRCTPQVAKDAEAFAVKIGLTPENAAAGKGTNNAQQRVLSVVRRLEARAKDLLPDQRREAQAQVGQWQASLLRISAEAFETASSQPFDLPKLTPQEAQDLANRPRDPAARATLRRLVALRAGAFPLYQLLEQQYAWISAEETDASVDSELALALFPDYPRFRWQGNPLQRPRVPAEPGAVMTARIDAPNLQLARRIIDDAIEVEKTGLKGTIALDSRGLKQKNADEKDDGYFWFDQTIRDAAGFLKEKTRQTLVTDDNMQVILPRTTKDVALYCGWYSLQNYIPGCSFKRGAVGYHVASLELTSMRNPLSKEWVPNLLKDGVSATLGAVSEPYLQAFPRPDQFFPILMTGDYTLAETYWLTVPMTSWKLILIGDPLYRPYAAGAVLQRSDLPAKLRETLEKIEAPEPNDR